MNAVRVAAVRGFMGWVMFVIMITNARADLNAITGIEASHTGSVVTLRIPMRQAPAALPGSFSTVAPPQNRARFS